MSRKEFFAQLADARRNGFIEFKELKENGQKVVGTYCTYTPKELITASGAIPVGLCGTKEEPIKAAERDLPRNLCPLIKSSYGYGITDKCPYFYFSDMLVAETTCDGKKKMYELLSKVKPMHVMSLPQTTEGKEACELWKNELYKLKSRLEQEFNTEITEQKLKHAIALHNEEHRILREFYELGKLCPPAISGSEMQIVLEANNFTANRDDLLQDVVEITQTIKKEYEQGFKPISKVAPRILITGCPMGGVNEKITKVIEDLGAVVVCFENCGGVKNLELNTDETIDPYDALTKKYLNICCSVMSPNKSRLDLLNQLIDEYHVDGVVEVVLQACHTYNIEAKTIKQFVNVEKETPYLMLETDFSQNDSGQIKTRLEAFIEMLG